MLKTIIILLIIAIIYLQIKNTQQLKQKIKLLENKKEQFGSYQSFWSFQSNISEHFDSLEQLEPTKDQQKYIDILKEKLQKFVDSQIQNPIEGTDSKRWQYIKNNKMQNIQGLSKMEQYIQHQFAYTENKGDLTKLCLQDDKGQVDVDLNMYVLLHELTHVYDTKYLIGQHDEYFWILFSKIIKRAVSEGILNPDIFKKQQCRCKTQVINDNDIKNIEEQCVKSLPKRE